MTISTGIGRGYWSHAGHSMDSQFDLSGRRFGRLLVVSKSRALGSDTGALWSCRCDCGQTNITRGTRLRSGRVTSCGRWCKAVKP